MFRHRATFVVALTTAALLGSACSDDGPSRIDDSGSAAGAATTSDPPATATETTTSSTTSSTPPAVTTATGTTTTTTTTATTATTTEPEASTATTARLDGPIATGSLTPPADPRGLDLDAIGYVQEEFFASGDATAYRADDEMDPDGAWTAEPTTSAPYATRLLVRRPADPARFSGAVVVEWMNVTVVETAPEWAYTSRSIVDSGAAWVGVSAQAIAIEGGDAAIQTGDGQQLAAAGGLRATNPDRYGSLTHPGDAYSYDIVSQVGAALAGPDGAAVVGGGTVDDVILAGESQSAWFLTTYVDAVHPVARVFDGFLVHSRGLGAARLDGVRDHDRATPVRFRTDLTTPVMVFETETDVGPVLGYAQARQPDTDHLRVWEVAGTAHADAFLVGPDFGLCAHSINAGPQHYVLNAAMASLLVWVEDGTPPPSGERIETTTELGTEIVRDDVGNAAGGIRTPSLDVPAATLSGEPPHGADLLCSLFGATVPFDAATMAARYGTRAEYLAAFGAALDAAIAAGFVRGADRELYAAEADSVVEF